MGKHQIINPYDILLSNQGFMKINGFEIAELKELEIKITPEMKEIPLLNSITKGKFAIGYSGSITFEFNKVFSRFVPSVLECAKYSQLFTFSLEATVYTNNQINEEYIYIGNCWLEGDIDLFSLKSDNDFLTQKFQAGFEVQSADFYSIINDDDNRQTIDDWQTSSFI